MNEDGTTRLFRADDGSVVEVEVVSLEPRCAYGRQAVIRFPGESETHRVGMSRLFEIKPPPVGTRIKLNGPVDRFPHFIAPKGATGTIVISDTELVAARMDEKIDGCEEWDNEVCWYPTNGDIPAEDFEVIS